MLTKHLLYLGLIFDDSVTNINLQGTLVPLSNIAKFLAIYFDKNLSWKNHIQYICEKVPCGIGILNRLRSMLPRNVLIMLYNALILPYLNYCNVVWGGTYPNRLLPLHILQKRVIRIIYNKSANYHTYELFKDMHTLSVFDIHCFNISVFIYS